VMRIIPHSWQALFARLRLVPSDSWQCRRLSAEASFCLQLYRARRAMAYEELRVRTLEHLRTRLPSVLKAPVVCFSHVERTDGPGVTGRVLANLAPLGVQDIPLLAPDSAAHKRGRVITKEPALLQSAVSAALTELAREISEAIEEGRVILCGWFAKAVFARTEILCDYLADGCVGIVPHPERWIREPRPVLEVLNDALRASCGDTDEGTGTGIATLEGFTTMLHECKAEQMREWWASLSPEDKEAILAKRRQKWESLSAADKEKIAESHRKYWEEMSTEQREEASVRRRQMWRDMPQERRDAINEKKRLTWAAKPAEEREAHAKRSTARWNAKTEAEKKQYGENIRARCAQTSAEKKAAASAKKSAAWKSMPLDRMESCTKKRLATRSKWTKEKREEVSRKHAAAAKANNLAGKLQEWKATATQEQRTSAKSKGAKSQINTKARKAEEAAIQRRKDMAAGAELTVDQKRWILRSYRQRVLQRAAGNLICETPVADELARDLQPDSSRSKSHFARGIKRAAASAEKAAPALMQAARDGNLAKTKARKIVAAYAERKQQRLDGFEVPETPLSDELAAFLCA